MSGEVHARPREGPSLPGKRFGGRRQLENENWKMENANCYARRLAHQFPISIFHFSFFINDPIHRPLITD
jgi:hypothetical protein